MQFLLYFYQVNAIDDTSTLVQLTFGALSHQAITWTNVDPDLCRNMTSLGHNELTIFFMIASLALGAFHEYIAGVPMCRRVRFKIYGLNWCRSVPNYNTAKQMQTGRIFIGMHIRQSIKTNGIMTSGKACDMASITTRRCLYTLLKKMLSHPKINIF